MTSRSPSSLHTAGCARPAHIRHEGLGQRCEVSRRPRPTGGPDLPENICHNVNRRYAAPVESRSGQAFHSVPWDSRRWGTSMKQTQQQTLPVRQPGHRRPRSDRRNGTGRKPGAPGRFTGALPGSSLYVGRVGALAVALGIGAAIASVPAVAFADSGTSDTSSGAAESRSAASSESGPDRTPAATAGQGREPSETDSDIADNESSDTKESDTEDTTEHEVEAAESSPPAPLPIASGRRTRTPSRSPPSTRLTRLTSQKCPSKPQS